MKTLSGVRIVALLGLGVAMTMTLRGLAQSPAAQRDPELNKFVLKIKKDSGAHHKLKHQANSKEEDDFKYLLCNGHYDKDNKIHLKHSDAGKADEDLPKDCGSAPSGTRLNIKTDKVTVSNTAQGIAENELAVIGPHVTIQVASSSTADIKAVLDKLEPTQ